MPEILVAPRVFVPDGVYESSYYTMGGGVELVAVKDGWNIDYAIVFTRGEYEQEYERLLRVLGGGENPARICASGSGGPLALIR